SQMTYLPTISVPATPLDNPLAHAVHSVTALDRQYIQKSPATNSEQLLATLNGSTVSRRTSPGLQAAIAIRAANFKQTRTLLDEVTIQSPDAAHLKANTPVPLSAIARIEVVKGPGAIAYGGSGNGAVINIITRSADQLEGGIGVAAGSHSTGQLNGYIG